LHLIDTVRHGLVSLGKPQGFVERQVRGWSDRWKGSQTTELPAMDQLALWLIERLPPEAPRPSLLHGDFKLDNVMLDEADLSRLVAVFDWEMSAVGDPLIDLGILLAYWVHTAPAAQRHSLDAVTRRPGWFSRAEILERYEQRTGCDLNGIRFYEVFAVFKLAVGRLQQIFIVIIVGKPTMRGSRTSTNELSCWRKSRLHYPQITQIVFGKRQTNQTVLKNLRNLWMLFSYEN
jgi:aminoglycoside phosphotransferase (APT) family kinase protein